MQVKIFAKDCFESIHVYSSSGNLIDYNLDIDVKDPIDVDPGMTLYGASSFQIDYNAGGVAGCAT